MVTPYKAIYFEVVGICNAKCAYCHSGVARTERARFIAPDLFHRTLSRLMAEQVVPAGAVISLYNWGEPALHPKLSEIVAAINQLGLKYALSTNASRALPVDAAFVANLDHLIFSMPGFSQGAYDRIHGFRFTEITANIAKTVSRCRELGYRGRFSISYHVYKFNPEDLGPCERFADTHGIEFNPYFAILNNWWEINDYVSDSLPPARRHAAKSDLYTLDEIDRIMTGAPKQGYRCPQNDYLNIDETGRVVTCCQIARDHPDYACGDVLLDALPATLERKTNRSVCRGCIGSGLAYYLNTALQTPPFYRPSMHQRILRARQTWRRIQQEGLGTALLRILKKRLSAPNRRPPASTPPP